MRTPSFLKSAYKKTVFLRFAIREWWPFWFYILNYPGRKKFQQYPVSLTSTQARIVNELRANGISFSSLDELFPAESLLETMNLFVAQNSSNLSHYSKKDFILGFWEYKPILDFANPFVDFAIQPAIHSIANAYMEMWTRLNYFHLAKTVPVGDAQAKFSQNWHRDSEEKRMLKVFVYLTDVDEEAGPFTYVKGSTYGNRYGNVAPQHPPEGSYPQAEIIEKKISNQDIVVGLGKAGTVIFCDTSGLHRGGHAKNKERIMSTTFYTADSWIEAPRYVHTPESLLRLSTSSPSVQYLLSKSR